MQNKEKILIITGDTTFGDNIMASLKASGYNVLCSHTGMDGVKAMYNISPQLILMDVTLPDLDTYEILGKKHHDDLISKIPLFMMSSQGVPINMRKVPEGSVTEFLMALHSNPEDVTSKVNRFFNHEPATADAFEDNSGNKKKILWVEDDKLIGTILAKKLISSGFDLFHAKTGEEALEALKGARPDAIVLDLLLPGMNGFDILTNINKDPGLKGVPIMILSNLSKATDIDRAKTLGAKKFLVKAATSLEQIVKEVNTLCQ